MSNTIAIIDYGMGNLHSVSKAVELVVSNTNVIVTNRAEEILNADRIIFPGVGAIGDCIAEIKRRGFDKVLHDVIGKKPLLGICVGMQALMMSSEESGGVECLGILPGRVKLFQGESFSGADKLKVPHMGWNKVYQKKPHPMWRDIEQDSRCYFVHSFYIESENTEQIVAQSNYGLPFISALAANKIFAVQFHPEKSHRIGLQLLKNFSTWNGSAN